MKNVKKLDKNVVDKLKELIKPNEKFACKSRPTVLICMTTFEGYGFSCENLYSCHVKSIT